MRRKVLVGMLFICTMILFLCAFISSASAATLYVPDDYPTIQAAVDAASDGDTIIVRDGTYVENVDVNKRLTIRSENGADFTTVKSTKSYESIFEIRADHVNISGFTVIGITANLCDGIALFSNYCNISYNTVSNNTYGIEIVESNNNKISENTVSNNNIGIDLGISANGNIISNNSITNNKGSGISIEYSDSNIITNNAILNNIIGIKLGGSFNIISNNSVMNNKGSGIYLHGGHNNKVYLNNFINNTRENIGSFYRSPSVKMNSTEKITYTYKGKTYTSYLGNYWSDYTGSDRNGDAIGDSPYPITSDVSDVYPLMKQFEVYFAKTKPTKTPTPKKPTTLEEKTEVPGEEEKGLPGFEAIFAIAGLMAVAYILRRNRR